MFLDKLQFGSLLLETPQGLVRIELSLGQRIYLLWTFRNFRRLSIALLNSRQLSLINSLFKSARIVSHSPNSSLVIGVVEGFVPLTDQVSSSPAHELVPKPILKQISKDELRNQTNALALHSEVTRKEDPVLEPSPTLSNSGFSPTKVATRRPPAPRLATAVGAVSLCIVSVIAWHRVQGIPASQAYGQPRIERMAAVAMPVSAPEAKPASLESGERRSSTASPPSIAVPIEFPEAKVAAETDLQAISSANVGASSSSNAIPPPRAVRSRDGGSALKIPIFSQKIAIQATRPPLHFVYPDYSEIRARGIVSLTAGLDPGGAVRTVRVVSGNRALAATAAQAVRQWRYRPYLKDGQPVATETNIVISFISEDAISMSFPPSIPNVH